MKGSSWIKSCHNAVMVQMSLKNTSNFKIALSCVSHFLLQTNLSSRQIFLRTNLSSYNCCFFFCFVGCFFFPFFFNNRLERSVHRLEQCYNARRALSWIIIDIRRGKYDFPICKFQGIAQKKKIHKSIILNSVKNCVCFCVSLVWLTCVTSKTSS